MKFTNQDVKEILALLDSASFDVMSLETERFKLTLRRNRSGEWTQEAQLLAPPNLFKSVETGPVADSNPVSHTSGERTEGTITVRAALPGTFYRAPRPGATAFVEEGSKVEADTVVGIIETMKLMTAVHAGARGTVAHIAIQNAQFAEQGALLMRIKPEAA
jgi:acetyl-CoA carboxylase biotin carboxyl carrier protein